MQQQSEAYYIFPVEIKLSAKELEVLKTCDLSLIRAFLKDKVNIGFTTIAQIRNFKQE